MDRSTPPPVRQFERLYLPEIDVRNLNDVTTLHTIRTGTGPANEIVFLWNAGTASMPHLATPAFVPNMMLQGTESRPAEVILDEIDFLGAFVSANESTHYTGFNSMSLNAFTGRMLDILADVLLHPVFPAERFAAMKRKALAEYDLKVKRSTFVAREKLNNLVVGASHPYLLSPTRSSIESQTLEQVRDAWSDGLFHSRLNIIVSGDIDDRLLGEVERFALLIGERSCGKSDIMSTPVVLAKPETPGVRRVEVPGASQSSIAMAIPAIARTHPDYIPLRIAVTALGGYFGSRLMQNIREEKGMTYGINASLAGSREGTTIAINADCDSKYTESVLNEINNEMFRMASEPMAKAEFDRLRSYYMTTIAAVIETFKSIGDFYTSRLTVGIPDDYFDRQQEVLTAITPDVLMEMAAKYFDTSNEITVVAG